MTPLLAVSGLTLICNLYGSSMEEKRYKITTPNTTQNLRKRVPQPKRRRRWKTRVKNQRTLTTTMIQRMRIQVGFMLRWIIFLNLQLFIYIKAKSEVWQPFLILIRTCYRAWSFGVNEGYENGSAAINGTDRRWFPFIWYHVLHKKWFGGKNKTPHISSWWCWIKSQPLIKLRMLYGTFLHMLYFFELYYWIFLLSLHNQKYKNKLGPY